jgi:hypothetical protein
MVFGDFDFQGRDPLWAAIYSYVDTRLELGENCHPSPREEFRCCIVPF